MPLLTLRQAADELGYSSEQSIRNLDAKGELTIVHLPVAGGTKRAKGPPRVDAVDVERLKARIRATAGAAQRTGSPARSQPVMPPPRRRSTPVAPQQRLPPQRRKPTKILNFE